MVVIWEFRENHVLRRITKDLARIQPRNKVRAKKVARGRRVQKCWAKEESRAKEDSLERKNKSREEISREGRMRARWSSLRNQSLQVSREQKSREVEKWSPGREKQMCHKTRASRWGARAEDSREERKPATSEKCSREQVTPELCWNDSRESTACLRSGRQLI